MLRVFQRYGDYEHKQRNRLKFLVKSMGWDAWQAAFQKELDEVRAAGGATLPFDPENPPVETAPVERAEAPAIAEITCARRPAPSSADLASCPVVEARDGGPGRERTEWLRTNLQPQKQVGYSQVTVSLRAWRHHRGQMRAVAQLARAYGDGTVRVTVDQNLVLRWVQEWTGAGLYRRLAAAGLGQPGAGTITDVTSCPGAESCRLAVTQSRGLGAPDRRQLETRSRALVRAASDVRIKISGCPNGCGQHHVAAIGFQGSIRKIGDRVVPQYFMMLGGGSGAGRRQFRTADGEDSCPADPGGRQPDAAALRGGTDAGETAPAFFLRVDPAHARAAVADLESMTAEDCAACRLHRSG